MKRLCCDLTLSEFAKYIGASVPQLVKTFGGNPDALVTRKIINSTLLDELLAQQIYAAFDTWYRNDFGHMYCSSYIRRAVRRWLHRGRLTNHVMTDQERTRCVLRGIKANRNIQSKFVNMAQSGQYIPAELFSWAEMELGW